MDSEELAKQATVYLQEPSQLADDLRQLLDRLESFKSPKGFLIRDCDDPTVRQRLEDHEQILRLILTHTADPVLWGELEHLPFWLTNFADPWERTSTYAIARVRKLVDQFAAAVQFRQSQTAHSWSGWHSVSDIQKLLKNAGQPHGRTNANQFKNDELAKGRMRYRPGKKKGDVQLREDLIQELNSAA